ncbi:recombinase family protein, partial [Streptomyces sp. NPDC050485]|uniref:recombinase family protein n=1 Tax=Streptomyces sp. NPDC050485 TaxID=3365617 RepID=UPI003790F089
PLLGNGHGGCGGRSGETGWPQGQYRAPGRPYLLGLKGAMSEAELHLLKARLQGGVLSKARRGELVSPLPIGFVYDSADKVVLDPDSAVVQSIRQVFDAFDAVGSASGVVKAFNQEGLLLPRRLVSGPDRGTIVWGPIAHSRVLQILHNPRYAGAFCFGRHRRQMGASGKMGMRLVPHGEWISLLPGAHPGYITFEKYEANQAKLTANAAGHGHERRAGPPREGPALLQGLVVCGICGHRMSVRYHQRKDTLQPEYRCQAAGIENGAPACQNVHGAGVDAAVGDLLVRALTPLALEAALAVADELTARAADADRLRAAAVEHARYRAELARRRYLAVDPDNRLVADTLEGDWNTALRELADATETYDKAAAAAAIGPDDAQRARITALASDFPALWNDPATPMRERKRLVRLLVTDVTLIRAQDITAHVRLRGGQQHTLTVPVPLPFWQTQQTRPGLVTAVDQLLEEHTDGQIAEILTSRGHVSGSGRPLNRRIIRNIRLSYDLRSHAQRLADQGMITGREIARELDVHPQTIATWRDAGLLDWCVANDKGDYLYHRPGPDFVRPAARRTSRSRPAPTPHP